MKILVVGQFQESSLEHQYVKYLSSRAEVFTYPAEDVFDNYYWSSNWNKITFRLGLSEIYTIIGKELLEVTRKINPDFVWVFKGMRILPKVLLQIKEMGVKLVNYNPDHPFEFSGKGSGNANVTNSVGLYDLHFCYDKRVQKRIEETWKIETALLPFGFQLSESQYAEIKAAPEVKMACFIGTCDRLRVQQVLEIASETLPIHVYGGNWSRMLPKNAKFVTPHPPVYGLDFWRTMRKYRLQLNIFRPHNIGTHNMRTFEAPAAGSIMLAPDSPDHRAYFKPQEEIFTYSSQDEMVAQAQYVLALNQADADRIRNNARQRSVLSDYSYEGRARQAFRSFSKMLEAV